MPVSPTSDNPNPSTHSAPSLDSALLKVNSEFGVSKYIISLYIYTYLSIYIYIPIYI